MGRPSFPSRELNSATHQTDTRPLSPPIPPHRPLLHNHFRFRDGHTYSHTVDPPFHAPPRKRGGGRSRELGARRLQRRETHPAATAAAAPEPEPERGRGGVCWERREPSGAGGPAGGEGRGESARRSARARTFGARQTHTLTRTECARDTRRAGARGSGWPPPSLPPLTLTRKWCCSSCSREPRFLHAPSLPPSPQQTQSRAAAERRRERRKRKGGREGNGNAGGAVMGKGGECKGRVTSGSGRAYPALPALRDTQGRSYDKEGRKWLLPATR